MIRMDGDGGGATCLTMETFKKQIKISGIYFMNPITYFKLSKYASRNKNTLKHIYTFNMPDDFKRTVFRKNRTVDFKLAKEGQSKNLIYGLFLIKNALCRSGENAGKP